MIQTELYKSMMAVVLVVSVMMVLVRVITIMGTISIKFY